MAALRAALILSSAVAAGCSATSQPAAVTAGDTCAHCRMIVSDARVAGQIAAPGEDALFYDDIGCLVKALTAGKPADHAYVADHRTGEWVRARSAVYTHVPALATPMGSHIIAHADDPSRRSDSAAAGGKPMSFDDVLSTFSRTERRAPSPGSTARGDRHDA